MAKRTKRDKESTSSRRLRITVGDDATHEELFHFRTTKTNFWIVVVLVVLAIMTGSYFLTSRTGLRHTVPGYPSNETKRMAMDNLLKIDSLEQVIDMWSYQMVNIQRIVSGKNPLTVDSLAAAQSVKTDDSEELLGIYASSDSLLREEIKRQEQINLASYSENTGTREIEGLHFFTPVKGIITREFDKAAGHPYIDIAAETGTMVYSILAGTVVSASWNDETGYVMMIQHEGDIISIYRHNEKLLKSTGDQVKAGTPIALVGNTGTQSTGSHLHFELWYKGIATDPTLYINF